MVAQKHLTPPNLSLEKCHLRGHRTIGNPPTSYRSLSAPPGPKSKKESEKSLPGPPAPGPQKVWKKSRKSLRDSCSSSEGSPAPPRPSWFTMIIVFLVCKKGPLGRWPFLDQKNCTGSPSKRQFDKWYLFHAPVGPPGRRRNYCNFRNSHKFQRYFNCKKVDEALTKRNLTPPCSSEEFFCQQLKKGVFGKGSFRNLCAELCFVCFSVFWGDFLLQISQKFLSETAPPMQAFSGNPPREKPQNAAADFGKRHGATEERFRW